MRVQTVQEATERRITQNTKTVDEFLRFYREWDSTVDKKRLDSIVKNVYSYYMTPEEAQIFIDAVSTFVENKVREKTGLKGIKVLPKPVGDEILLVASINVKLDKPRKIILAEYGFMKSGEVTETIQEFNNYLNDIIDDISNEAKTLIRYLKQKGF